MLLISCAIDSVAQLA